MIRRTLDSPAGRWLPPLAWMTLNVWLSHQPRLPGPSAPWLDKAEHAAFFGVFGWLLARAWLPALARRTRRERAMILLGAALLWAVSDEIHQAFVPGRSADPLDILADLLGASIAVWHRHRKMHA